MSSSRSRPASSPQTVRPPDLLPRVAAVRRFNRFYTKQIGVLEEGYLHSPFSLAGVRVLYEIAQRSNTSASTLGKELGLDAGYLSRILRDFERRGFIERRSSAADARQSLITLAPKGRETFIQLNAQTDAGILEMLSPLPNGMQQSLVEAMQTIEAALGGSPVSPQPYVLRSHRPGDIGWVIHRHGALYAQEYGWDERFEALVAKVAAQFIEQYDPKRERCWIAEQGGEIVGSVFLVQHSKTVAKLRLLLVEPRARGCGLGSRLVEECIRFAQDTGYRTMTLWTQDVLRTAHHLYQRAGFHLVREEAHSSFGPNLIGQTWERSL